jgi:nucleoside-diphosphate-sugar epimerase
VRGRNSDNARVRAVLDWEPRVSLEQGLTQTYRWIEQQLRERQRVRERTPLASAAG